MIFCTLRLRKKIKFGVGGFNEPNELEFLSSPPISQNERVTSRFQEGGSKRFIFHRGVQLLGVTFSISTVFAKLFHNVERRDFQQYETLSDQQ